MHLDEDYEKLQVELAEFKLLELSLGKRIENLVFDVNEYEAGIEELEAENGKLLEALENWNKSFQSVIEHKHHFDTNVFNLFNERYIEAREAIQGEPG